MTGRRPTPVHLAHVLSSFGMGGQERVALDLAARQVAAGYRVTVVSLARPPEGPLAPAFRAAGAAVATIPRARDGLDPALLLRLARWMRASGVALAHTHNRMPLLYAAPSAWLAGVPVVHSKHGPNPGSRAELVAARAAARCVDVFVAVSRETADVARLQREVSPSRLSVIPNGIDLGRFGPDPARAAPLREELGAGGAFVVGTVGRAAPAKNQALLVRAMAPLLGEDTRLVVAGDGPLLGSLRELAASLGVGAHVHLLGARADVPDVLRALDLFVLPSASEGLPLVLPEAMATGLPVIATRVGGVPDVVEEGTTGHLVAPDDVEALRARIVALRDDPAARRALGARGREVALARYSADRMHRDYVAIYERILG